MALILFQPVYDHHVQANYPQKISQNGPVQARGYWSTIYVRDGDAWKIRMSIFNQTPPASPPAQTK
jgi:hypothetical protein